MPNHQKTLQCQQYKNAFQMFLQRQDKIKYIKIQSILILIYEKQHFLLVSFDKIYQKIQSLLNLLQLITSTPAMNEKMKAPFDLFPSMENMPQVHHTLKMINTVNAFPHNISENIDIPQCDPKSSPQEDSFAQRCSHVQTPNNSAKKKKNGCTCKKTFCLKMYCQCFSTSKKCGEDCACISCKNNEQFQEDIHAAKTGIKEGGIRNCSLSQKRCNCKKSHCLKRYCECFNSGVGCSESCKCQGCENREKKEVPHRVEQEIEQIQKNQSSNLREQPRNNFEYLNLSNCGDDLDKFYL